MLTRFRFRNAENFKASIEVASYKSAIECPSALLNSTKDSPDLRVLSILTACRDFLQSFLFGGEWQNFSSVDEMCRALARLDHGGVKTDGSFMMKLREIKSKLQPLEELVVSGGEGGGAIARLKGMLVESREAVWVCSARAAESETVMVISLRLLEPSPHTSVKQSKYRKWMAFQVCSSDL